MATKGKEEALVCGERGGAPVAGRLRVLDRDRAKAPGLAAFGAAERGDVLAPSPAVASPLESFADGARLGADVAIERLDLDPGRTA